MGCRMGRIRCSGLLYRIFFDSGWEEAGALDGFFLFKDDLKISEGSDLFLKNCVMIYFAHCRSLYRGISSIISHLPSFERQSTLCKELFNTLSHFLA